MTMWVLLLLALVACESSTNQVGGLIGQVNYQTFACLPQDQTLMVRNDNMQEPQRIQAVMFELGTNKDKFYKISKVVSNGVEYKSMGDIANEIIIPPGGTMEVTVTYKPRKVTFSPDTHVTYLDIVLNGPKLGILQLKLNGTAEKSLPGCGQSSGSEFEVIDMTTYMIHEASFGSNNNKTKLGAEAVEGNFSFELNEQKGTAKMTEEGWPTVAIPLPPGQALSELKVDLLVGEYEGTFDGVDLEIPGLILDIPAIATIDGVTLTSKSVDLTTEGGHLALTGSPLSGANDITLVLAVELEQTTFPALPEDLNHAIFGAEIKLHKK
ncbi:MAG: hypothetical protein HYU97_04235 [Deltaproteobacteria bacterium]|nr:hypothetical protein [Deltaproteobacteria bacterium]